VERPRGDGEAADRRQAPGGVEEDAARAHLGGDRPGEGLDGGVGGGDEDDLGPGELVGQGAGEGGEV
jgi:hypothetical protein